MKRIPALIGFAAAAGLYALAAGSQTHSDDIILYIENDRIMTGEDEGKGIVEHRVFASEFGEGSVFNFTDEPGFDSANGTFPPFSTVGFNIRAALAEWTGSDFGPTDKSITINLGALEVTTGEGFVPGFGAQANSNGRWHRHLGFTLNNATEQEAGVYLLELEMWHESTAIEPSAPFFIVFNFNEDVSTWEDAIAYVEAMLEGTAADLIDLNIIFGSIVEGGIDQLREPDDDPLVLRSQFGFSAQEPNLLQFDVRALTGHGDPQTLDLTIKGRLNNPGGAAGIALRDWSKGIFQQVHQFGMGTSEIVETVDGLSANSRVSGEGHIDLRLKVSVIATFSATGFDAFIDLVRIDVH